MHPIEAPIKIIIAEDTEMIKEFEDLGSIEELPPSYEISETNIKENLKEKNLNEENLQKENLKEEIIKIDEEEKSITKINLNNLKDSYILLNIQHVELLNKIKKQELKGGHINKRFSR